MKNKLLRSLIAGITLGIAAVACAQFVLPSYKSFSATGTTSASVIVDYAPNSQIRFVSLIASSDLSSSTVSMYSGTTAHYTTVTNASGTTTITLESVTGVANNALLYIKGNSTNWIATVSSVSGNVVTVSSAINIAIPLNAEVEVLSQPVVFGQGANTYKIYASDGLFVGNYGRAAYCVVTGTSTSRVDSLTVHYDATSQ